MTRSEFYERYASVVVSVGLNVQKGQEMIIRAPIEAREFVPHIVRAAYRREAKLVQVEYRDQAVARAFLEDAPSDSLGYVPPGTLAERLRVARSGGALLTVLGEDPSGLAGVDPKRRGISAKAQGVAAADIRELTMKDFNPWCVVSAPNPVWARAVYPDVGEEDALERLFASVAHACRLDQDDPVEAWDRHRVRLLGISHWLDDQHFDRFHYTAPGTDFTVGMPKNQHWIATESTSANGITFIPNLPTDEIFSAPDWRRADGTIRSTRPLIIGGINVGFANFVVSNGTIVEAHSEREEAILVEELDRDDRSRHFGEVALVSEDAPIAELGTTFFDGLYDENAGCHFAFGAAYSACVAGGAEMTPEQRQEAGLNQSEQHFDFTVGSSELEIVAYTADGRATTLMTGGRFTKEVLAAASAAS